MAIKKHVMKIGIATPEQQRKRVMEIASGRRPREKGEPRVWFPSLKAAAEILERNRDLIRIIWEQQPESVKALAAQAGRAESNVSRSLKRLEAVGIIRMVATGRTKRPIGNTREFDIHISY